MFTLDTLKAASHFVFKAHPVSEKRILKAGKHGGTDIKGLSSKWVGTHLAELEYVTAQKWTNHIGEDLESYKLHLLSLGYRPLIIREAG